MKNTVEILISLGEFGGGEYLKLSFKVVDKETKDMLNTIVGKHYNLEVMKDKNCVCAIKMTPSDLQEVHLVKYNNVKLMNVNGLGIGYAHFLTENGEYLLLPWCYIVSMVPSENKD